MTIEYCDECEGEGYTDNGETCDNCDGSGILKEIKMADADGDDEE